ncbi:MULTISPECIES: Na+/H+ antiporter NhaA [unclassified Microbacterium]|uniref:Na+/H+ antiporter NhaA n=1 Tax=unclassified Microbacterium TaxID=2609290 RepID=UPI000EA8E923|nr:MULTISPECIES: Na+/H+ antiporter NhaA [unclassified Microbacterium]MBT2484428.1 Na+/H+ antiporter NhaA [Microbacterium sp. ISL-108]RKN67337.1 Na+/H+ antiporter NhaA [Microbacterium sp. CGR2]
MATHDHPFPSEFPARGSYREARRIGTLLRKESVGGILLVVMAAIALIWSNSPFAEGYFALRDFEIGYEPWHLKLSLGAWAADGLLAIFFFLVGLELKREFVIGDLRDIRRAIVPVAAAIGGVVVPALVYVLIVGPQPDLLRGWAVPTATDIAFAVAILAIIGSHLPAGLRLFLLTLAVVDDLIAIVIIAVFYTDDVNPMPIPGAILALALYALLAQRRKGFFLRHRFAAWLILLPIGVVVWALVHASGIHATIAGVLLGFMIPVRSGTTDADGVEETGLAEEFEHRFRPLSAGFAVPIFAFFAAGVTVVGDGLVETLTHPVTIAIVVALVLGKPIGIVLSTWIATKLTRSRMSDGLGWIDLIGVGVLAGIGFTVSLLVADLSFPQGIEHDAAKVAILLASVLAAALAAVILGIRNRRYRAIAEREAVDADADGVPDVYQRGDRA